MATVKEIENSYENIRHSAVMKRAFASWQRTQPCLRRFCDVEDLIQLCRDGNPDLYQQKNEVIAALCLLAKSPDRPEADEIAGLLLLWLFAGAMRNIAKQIGSSPLSLEELDSEMLAGFWEEASRGSHDSKALSNRLYNAARRSAWKAVAAARRDTSLCMAADLGSIAESDDINSGCPLLVLRRARRQGIISDLDADLIRLTRLEGRSLADLAAQIGLKRTTCAMARTRAEERLAVWLRSEAS